MGDVLKVRNPQAHGCAILGSQENVGSNDSRGNLESAVPVINDPVFRSRKARWATTVLGGVLFAQGTGKLLDPGGYIAALEPFAVISDSLLWPVSLWPLGVLWLGTELVSGFGLLVAGLALAPPKRFARISAGLAVAVTAAYLLMTGQAYVRGLEIENCTCFGVYLAQRLSGFVLVQDIYMIVYATWQQRRIRIW